MSGRLLHAGSAQTFAPPHPSEMLEFHLTPHRPPRANNETAMSNGKTPALVG